MPYAELNFIHIPARLHSTEKVKFKCRPSYTYAMAATKILDLLMQSVDATTCWNEPHATTHVTAKLISKNECFTANLASQLVHVLS